MPVRYFLRFAFLILCYFLLLTQRHAQVYAQSCNGADGVSPVGGGLIQTIPGDICANSAATPGQMRIEANNVDDGGNPNAIGFRIDWDDGTAVQDIFVSAGQITNTGPNSYQALVNHFFPPTGGNVKCEYFPTVRLLINGAPCPATLGIPPRFVRWNTDDQNTGELLLAESVSGAVEYLVCEGVATTVTFSDQSTLNCVPPELLTNINETRRWRMFTYGTASTITGTVLINGTPQAFPFDGPVLQSAVTGIIVPFPPTQTEAITVPATAVAGEFFELEMSSWNFCNRFDLGNAPVTTTGRILVVAQPPAPTAVNSSRCAGTALPNFEVTIPMARSRIDWYEDNAGTPGAPIVNPNGTNSRFLPPTAYPGGIDNTVPGVYQVWASYSAVANVQNVSCESELVPVTITVLPAPIAAIASPTQDLCNVLVSDPLQGNVPPVGTGTWSVVFRQNPVATVAFLPDANTPNATASVSSPGTYIFRWTITSGICSSFDEITVNFGTNAVIADAGPDPADVCGFTTTLNAVAPSIGTGQWDVSALPMGVTIADPLNPASQVTVGSPGSYTFTWVVSSGSCSPPSTDDVDVVFNALPDAIYQTPVLCDETPGNPVESSVDLTTYNAAVANGAVNRTVFWYQNAAPPAGVFLGSAPPLQLGVTTGAIYVARVQDNATLCTQDATVTFTINDLPPVTDNTTNVCEDAQGAGQATNVDLTDANFVNAVIGTNPNVTVRWFNTQLDAQNDVNEIIGPITITASRTVFARVIDNLPPNCFDVAQLDIVVTPLPVDQVIFGKDEVCEGGLELYQLSPVAGATYIWNIPPQFTIYGGADPDDYFALLQFPTSTTGTISVSISVSGCGGLISTKDINVSPTPVGSPIAGDAVVCENDIGVAYSVGNNPGSSYNWEVFPSGAALIANGQTTSNILMNFLTNDITLVVQESNAANCAGPSQQLFIEVNRRPAMLNPTKEICSDAATEITFQDDPASPVPATSYDISSAVVTPGVIPVTGPTTGVGLPASGIFNDRYENLNSIPLTVRYTVTPVNTDPFNLKSCPSPFATIVTVSVKPEPQLDPNLSKSLCSDQPTEITLVSAPNTFPADRFIIESISNPSGLVERTPPVATGVQLSSGAIFNTEWENTSAANGQITYSITPYSTVLGCEGDPPTSVQVTVFPKPNVTPVAPLIICSNDKLNIALTTTPAIPGVSFIWTIKSIQGNIVGATAGIGTTIGDILVNNDVVPGQITYEVLATNNAAQGNCLGPAIDIVVTVNPSPVAVDITAAVCSDDPGGSIYTEDLVSLQPLITSQVATFTWYSNAADPAGSVISGAALNAYPLSNSVPVFALVDNGTCSRTVFVNYTVNPLLSIASTASDFNGFNLQCNDDLSGSITTLPSMGTPPYSFSLDGGPFFSLQTFDFLQAGQHTVVVQDAKGCQQDTTMTLVEPPVLDGNVIESSPVVCFLDRNAILETVATGGTGAYTNYLLLQSPSNTTGQLNGIFQNIGAGTYSVRITDSNGCTFDTPTLTITQPTQVESTSSVVEDANGFQLSCNNAQDGVINVTAQGGNGANFTYTLVRAGDPLNPFATITGSDSESFTNLPFGNYTITVQDQLGCPSQPSIAVIVNPPPFEPGFVGINQSICSGDDPAQIDELVAPFGGVLGYQFQWQESLTGSLNDAEWSDIAGANASIFVPPAGLAQTTFYRRLVRTGSCAVRGQENRVEVRVNPLPVVTFGGPAEVCQGESFFLNLDVSVGSTPIEYDYSNGVDTFVGLIGSANTLIPVSNFQEDATYTLLRVEDMNGCEIVPAVAPVTVSVVKIDPSFVVLAPDAQCPGGVFSFEWTVEPDVQYTWLWADNSQTVVNANERTPGVNTIQHVFAVGSPVTSTIYPVQLQAENILCSPKSASRPVTVYPFVSLNINPSDTIICSGEQIVFKNQSQGVDFSRWYYRPLGSTDELDVRTTDDVTYVLTNDTDQNPLIYEVVYEGDNAEGCGDTLVQQVVVYRSVTAAFATGPIPDFAGGIATVDFSNTSTPVHPDFEYTWDFGDNRAVPSNAVTIGPITVDYFSPGMKNVILRAVNIAARDQDGKICQSSFSQVINIPLPNVAAAFIATPLASCYPSEITIENLSPGADTFEWEVYGPTGLVTTSNLREPVFKITQPGTYDIYLTASFAGSGQTALAEQRGIVVFDRPQANFDLRPTTVFVPDTEMRTFNFTTHATDYEWNFGESSEVFTDFEPKYTYQYEGNYIVTMLAAYDNGSYDVDGDGPGGEVPVVCYDTATQEVFARAGGTTKIPNAFTPSPNGPSGGVPGASGSFNDVFLPITRGVEEFEMQIFDRWGNLVFVSHDKDIGWDGYDRGGRLMPAGVYVYKLTLRLSDEQRTTQIGDVTLVR